MEDPKFLKRFSKALRPGAYLRIVEEGDIGAGDEVEVTQRPGHGVTIGLFAEAYLGDRSLLARLLDAEALAPRWREWVEDRLQATRSAPA
jgi:MOSC domain-containing protein YiiM